MSEVKRYEPEYDTEAFRGMTECVGGRYVLYGDYAALECVARTIPDLAKKHELMAKTIHELEATLKRRTDLLRRINDNRPGDGSWFDYEFGEELSDELKDPEAPRG